MNAETPERHKQVSTRSSGINACTPERPAVKLTDITVILSVDDKGRLDKVRTRIRRRLTGIQTARPVGATGTRIARGTRVGVAGRDLRIHRRKAQGDGDEREADGAHL